MMKIAIKKATRAGRVAAAMVSAGLLLVLAGTAQEAEATFPGNNGKIAFASNRTTGEGVNNPEGDFEIFTMNRDGTGLTQLTHNASFDFAPDWSSDGKRIAFESTREGFSEIFVMNSDGSEQTKVTTNPDFSFDRAPTFSPDGQRIAFESNRAVGEGVDNPEKDTEIFVVALDGLGVTQLTHNGERERDIQPDYAPDGKKIAFVSDRDFRPGIYTMNADGTKQKKRSRGAATVFESPSYAPDGERIAFMSNQDGPDEIHTMNVNGSDQQRLTDNGIVRDSSPVFSPNGKKIAFNTNRDGNFEIYKMHTDGKQQINLTNDPAGDFTPDWQPLQEKGY
jgi:Tol biopolymer transport system component